MVWYQRLPAFLRWPLWFLLRLFVFAVEATFGLAVFLLLVVFFVLGSQWGRETLLTEGLRRGLALTPFEVDMSDVTSLQPSQINLDHFKLSYRQHTLVEVDHLSIEIPWESLRSQDVRLEHLQVDRLDVDADPAHWPSTSDAPDPANKEPEENGGILPEMLADWRASVGQIQLSHLQIRHPILPEPLQGGFKLENFSVSQLTQSFPLIELQQFRLGLDEGRHWIRGQIKGDQIAADVHLDRFPLDVVDAFLDDFNTGWLSASLKVSGSLTSPHASGHAETDTRLLNMPLQASTDLSYRDLMIRIKKFDGRWERLQAQASGKVDLHAGTLDIQVKHAQTPIEFIKGFGATLPDELKAEIVAENVAVTGPYAEVRYKGAAQATGQFRALPFTLKAAVDGGVSAVRLNGVALQTDQGSVAANADIDFGGRFKTDATVNALSVGVLKALSIPLPPAIENDLTARLDGQIRAGGSFARPQFQTELNVSGHYREQALAIEAHASGDLDRLSIPVFSVTLDENQTVPSLAGEGTIDLKAQTLNLTTRMSALPLGLVRLADVQLPKDIDGQLSGTLVANGPWVSPALQTQLDFQGTAKSHAFSVGVDAGLENRMIDVKKAEIVLDDRRILGLEGQLSDHQQTLALKIAALDLKQLNDFGVKQAKGRLNANVRYKANEEGVGLAGRINYGVDVEWTDADGKISTIPIELNTRISTTDQTTSFNAQVLQQGHKTSDIDLRFPVGPYREWVLAALQGASEQPLPANLSLDGNLDLGSIEAFLPNDLEVFAGLLEAHLRTEGTFPQPEVFGTVELKQGRYLNELTGTDLHEIELLARLEGTWLSLEKAAIHTPENGVIDLSGQFEWAGDQTANITALARDAVVLERPDVEAAISGQLALTGDNRGYKLGGSLNLKPLTINVNSAYSGVPEIKVKVIESKQAKKTLTNQAAGKTGSIPLVLDIAVIADQQAYLRGRGLATELKGVVNVVGPLKKLRFTGNFETIRGSIELFGKRFTLVRGTAEFDGANVILDIEAEHEGKEETFKVRVTGTLDDFKLELTSDPVLPQDEVLSRLLFGKSVKSISPMQAVRLITAIQTLQGGNSLLPDPISYARDLVGVDDLNVESTETKEGDKGVSVGVGKYLSEGVYFELKRTPDPNKPWQGTLDIELTPSLHLETTTSGSAGEEGVELIWKRDY